MPGEPPCSLRLLTICCSGGSDLQSNLSGRQANRDSDRLTSTDSSAKRVRLSRGPLGRRPASIDRHRLYLLSGQQPMSSTTEKLWAKTHIFDPTKFTFATAFRCLSNDQPSDGIRDAEITICTRCPNCSPIDKWSKPNSTICALSICSFCNGRTQTPDTVGPQRRDQVRGNPVVYAT